MEKVAATVYFPCRYHNNGCQSHLLHTDKIEHEGKNNQSTIFTKKSALQWAKNEFRNEESLEFSAYQIYFRDFIRFISSKIHVLQGYILTFTQILTITSTEQIETLFRAFF